MKDCSVADALHPPASPRPLERLIAHVAGKIRVHELAKELGLTNKEALDLSIALGIGVKSHSSSIEEAQADRVRRRAERDGLKRDVQPEEPKKAVRRGRGAEDEVPVAASAVAVAEAMD